MSCFLYLENLQSLFHVTLKCSALYIFKVISISLIFFALCLLLSALCSSLLALLLYHYLFYLFTLSLILTFWMIYIVLKYYLSCFYSLFFECYKALECLISFNKISLCLYFLERDLTISLFSLSNLSQSFTTQNII